MNTLQKPKIWITYAWADNTQGDFENLVQELEKVGVEAKYDKIEIVTGQYIWEQIAKRITEDPMDGWAILLTPNSLKSKPCREELEYALLRTLKTTGDEFPLIGLLHGVKIDDVPPALQVRRCVNLASSTWREEIKAGLERRTPIEPKEVQTKYFWKVNQGFMGNPTAITVEVRPRFDEIMYWRFAVPTSASIVNWGYGPSCGGPLAGLMMYSVEGNTYIKGIPAKFFGAGDRLSPGVSAYVVFKETLPDFVGFGVASMPFGTPKEYEIVEFGPKC